MGLMCSFTGAVIMAINIPCLEKSSKPLEVKVQMKKSELNYEKFDTPNQKTSKY